jgi:hypothetical protein
VGEDKRRDGFNKRDMKRHYLIYYLRVLNRDTGDSIGHLVDVTPHGIMVIRDSPLEVGSRYSLRIRWRNGAGNLKLADFNGVCRWCQPDVNPDFYGAGFSITPINIGDVESIAQLINDMAMPDGVSDNID